MGYNTALTEWPAMQIPEAVKQHIDKFFSIMDTSAPSAGDRLAKEIFARDGVMDSLHRAEGTEGTLSPNVCGYEDFFRLILWKTGVSRSESRQEDIPFPSPDLSVALSLAAST